MKPPRKTEHDLDLALAAQLQAALLPKQCPRDCPHQVAAARNRMCATVGGDFYDFIRMNEDQYAIVVGDVVGHGVRASLLMAQIMGYLRAPNRAGANPVEVVGALNHMLLEIGGRTDSVMLCSLFYALIDAPSGLALFVNAGHPSPLLCDRGKCRTLQLGPRNVPLGVEKVEFEEACHTFSPGERMVLYTDGLTDAASPGGDHFGANRLHEAINRHMTDSPEACADAVFLAVAAFRGDAPQTDDETIIVIDRV